MFIYLNDIAKQQRKTVDILPCFVLQNSEKKKSARRRT